MTKYKKTYRRRFRKYRKRHMRKNKPANYKFKLANQPTNRYVCLKYSTLFILQPTSGGPVHKMFYSNSPFNVDGSGASNALGYADWTQFFNSWYVQSSYIKVGVVTSNDPTVAQVPVMVTCYSIADTSPPSGTINEIAQQSRCRYKLLANSQNVKPSYLINRYNPKSIFGYKNVADADELYGTVSILPVLESAYWVSADTTDGSPINQPITLHVEIYFCTVFNDSKRLNV